MLAPPRRDAWKGPGGDTDVVLPTGTKPSSNVVGLTLLYGPNGLGAVPRASGGSGVGVKSILALTGTGRAIRLDLARTEGTGVVSCAAISTVFYFHYGPLWTLCADINGTSSRESGMFVTGGEDTWLSVWCSKKRQLLTRQRARAPIKSVDIFLYDKSTAYQHANAARKPPQKADMDSISLTREAQQSKASSFLMEACVAVGLAAGAISVFLLTASKSNDGGGGGALLRSGGPAAEYALKQFVFRKDCAEDIRCPPSSLSFAPPRLIAQKNLFVNGHFVLVMSLSLCSSTSQLFAFVLVHQFLIE